MADTTTTYGGLSADEWRDDAGEDRLNHVGAQAILEAFAVIDRLQRMIDEAQISNSNPPERQMPLTDGEMAWKARAEKAEAERDALKEALELCAMELLGRD